MRRSECGGVWPEPSVSEAALHPQPHFATQKKHGSCWLGGISLRRCHCPVRSFTSKPCDAKRACRKTQFTVRRQQQRWGSGAGVNLIMGRPARDPIRITSDYEGNPDLGFLQHLFLMGYGTQPAYANKAGEKSHRAKGAARILFVDKFLPESKGEANKQKRVEPPKVHDSVNKDRARLASENKQSEHSQMGFPLQSCVNERKQGSASQGLHCDTVGRSTSSGVMEGNLQEFGPRSYLRSSVRNGNPRLGYLENSDSTSALTLLYQRMFDNVFSCTFRFRYIDPSTRRGHCAERPLPSLAGFCFEKSPSSLGHETAAWLCLLCTLNSREEVPS
ncbi:hypothetical protein EYF80_013131 [Liparis tanakae]|uniref:Uncharacterized protein n=1 Tax=Liparis tanakae TaxID=230148 RepID=A0A4Z2IF66_9TELE|nr:hypothetical protein EYF80_013131 [Liparis tanakae]